ncbi:MAG: hypothetical protein D6732_02025 [Methanobacteriota archaeon]|nr:MAG: hypothetical protein D6732_02025 [Euryarchaeota archaeon]
MYPIKPVGSAFILVLVLAIASLAISTQFGEKVPSYPLVPVSSSSVWDFTSSLTLAQGFISDEHEVIYFSTEGILIDAVLGESSNIEASCSPEPCEGSTFAYAGTGTPIYTHDTHHVSIRQDMDGGGWIGDITYNSSTFGWRSINFAFENVDLDNISFALTKEVSGMKNLRQVNESSFGTLWRDQIHLNNTEIRIHIAYTDGVFLYISIIEGKFFLRVSYFSEYYSNYEGARFRSSDRPDAYYVAELETFFPVYVNAVNNLIELILED